MTVVAEDPDLARRSELRSFLTERRSRLLPSELGLPATSRRRVPGLRRQEVAELLGVSDDWYRWFESGRPISVSSRFLSRLCQVLRLNAVEQLTLYRLAVPDLYHAFTAARIFHTN